MILLEPRPRACCDDGVLEGRRTFGNIMKYIMMGTSSNFGNMFSMAGATLFLPFLPMLPVQILLNNLLYDLSEIPIPLDDVDAEAIGASRSTGTCGFIRNFMLVLGPVSSVFDFLTFCVLLLGLPRRRGAVPDRLVHRVAGDAGAGDLRHPHARAARLRAGRIRLLAATSLGVVAVAVLLPFTPVGSWFGFVAPSPALLAAIAGLVVVYLLLAQGVKAAFYRLYRPSGIPSAARLRPHLPLVGRS